MTAAMSQADAITAPRRGALAFILLTVLLDVLALGVIIPVLPGLIGGFLGNDTEKTSFWYGIFVAIWSLMQFLFSPFIGALSDRFGRRPLILLSNFGLGFDYVLMALAPNLGLLFIGRVVSGITAATIPTAYAYIADVTPPEKRAGAFGMVGAAFGLGFILGPALGGMLGGINPHLPFWIAAGLSLLNAMYGLFVLPESLPRNRRASFHWTRANPVGSLNLLRSHPELLGLATVGVLFNLAHEVLPSVFVLFTQNRYQWGPMQVGLTLAVVGVCGVIVQGGLAQPIVGRLGERRVLIWALMSGFIGFTFYGCAPNGYWFFAGVPVLALWGLSGPAALGLMSRRVDHTEQGRLQGANSSLRGITGSVGPLLFTQTYSLFIGRWKDLSLPGAPFFLSALLLISAACLAWFVTKSNGSSELAGAGAPFRHEKIDPAPLPADIEPSGR